MHGAIQEFGVDLLMHSFYTDSEANVPTYFNTIILFIPSILLAIIGLSKSLIKDKFKFLFFFSLAIYVSGVIGGEMLSGHFADTIGLRNFTYAVYTSIEESLEWIGASLTIYSLLKYMQQYLPEGITIKVP
ncbi:MAG: hypothetical protein ACYC6R_04380 [Anaerolineales bacterium]